MTCYAGPALCTQHVCIGPVLLEQLDNISIDHDVRAAVYHYRTQSPGDPSIVYFGIFWDAQLVGQIVLHDIDVVRGESLVAYHLFTAAYRQRGIGASALRLLQQYASSLGTLCQLTIITSCDNLASQRLAATCGFHCIGPAREDPAQLLVFVWKVPELAAVITHPDAGGEDSV